jgi:hypothetical protein
VRAYIIISSIARLLLFPHKLDDASISACPETEASGAILSSGPETSAPLIVTRFSRTFDEMVKECTNLALCSFVFSVQDDLLHCELGGTAKSFACGYHVES